MYEVYCYWFHLCPQKNIFIWKIKEITLQQFCKKNSINWFWHTEESYFNFLKMRSMPIYYSIVKQRCYHSVSVCWPLFWSNTWKIFTHMIKELCLQYSALFQIYQFINFCKLTVTDQKWSSNLKFNKFTLRIIYGPIIGTNIHYNLKQY